MPVNVKFENIAKGRTDWTVPLNANFDEAKRAVEELEAVIESIPTGPTGPTISTGGATYAEFITPADGWEETEDGYQTIDTGLLVEADASLLISANILEVNQLLTEISMQAVNDDGHVFLLASAIPEAITIGITSIKMEEEV